MKSKVFIILNLIVLLVFISCDKKNKKQYYDIIKYYDTGEVYKTEKKINEHETEAQFYFKNSQIKQEGMTYDSLKNGLWKTYYNDGVLRGEMIYSKDKFIKEIIKYPIVLDFENNPTEFRVGNTYQFRVLGVSFYSIEVPRKLGYRRIQNDDDLYLFEITPKTACDDTIMVIIDYFKKAIKNDSIFFPIKVIE